MDWHSWYAATLSVQAALLAVSAALAFASSLGAGSLASAAPAASDVAAAMTTTERRICFSSNSGGGPLPGGSDHGALGWDLAGGDVIGPELVMLLGPALVDVAGLHRPPRAGDADRPHVSVADEHRDDEHRRDGVHDVRDLHLRPRQIEPGNDLVEHEARRDDERREHDQ